ncbi:glutaminyl-tRNA synthase (glutamine-hydrolyzing) subunit A [Candidatus Roizmanbacteria bacterium RIFCSPHIGHO2_02_FULL_37_13b]|uniref:Glutamyl-tRNA(Gln) amidotransferase subunit A n=1 Tax=Candidatus Roizmanbacteria bacterium RIFCSPLOWO2_02_FULL_36_11 TaxID=1802071 RepID=A0A1F7JFZ6_9BACT|nr:MAG: glutaminyl-tRNA synthase (glutamine-hydrolyzing) subunit A [Candidatus Roizmanbacteria bacterium RIFCSPHIGHO2_02_FULL_37_13b]OGK54551.1 MAG: glutaminyl-tRNA synthase (glutamine-hydrolyzing) subunit A [Candidatus Roizmanbacteria bacterium RIFCSPLOWO2_02_FULL_36_11]
MKLLGKSVIELKKLLLSKQLKVEELYDYFLNRITKYDKEINSYLSVIVDSSDQVIKNIGNLSGIPVAIKDNFCTQGVRTSAASIVLADFIPPYDSTVVARIKKESGVIIGKTNTDAWAHGSSTETSDFGVTKNPMDYSRVAGGSSGGSAASVASYLSPIAIGSETAGSIRIPAGWCGVVGLKPTYGRISRYGVIAMGSSWDCPGILALNVADVALLLQIIAGRDPYDATSVETPVVNYGNYLNTKKTYTIGIADEYFNDVNEEICGRIDQCIQILKKSGHKIRKVKLIDPKYAVSVYTILQRSEVSSNLGRYDGIRYGSDRSAFGKEAKTRIMLGTYTLSHGYYDAYYKKALKARQLIRNDFEVAFKDVDFIVGPTAPCTALKIGESEKYPFFGEMMDKLCEPASAAGIPAINLPVGLDKKDLPIGLQIMANHFREEDLLNISYQFEKETEFFGIKNQMLKLYPD